MPETTMERRPVSRLPRELRAYALAVFSVAAATWVTLRIHPLLGESISPLFFAAVMISAWYGGWGPGLVATSLAGWASAYWFRDNPPGQAGPFGVDDWIRLGVFIMVAVLISSLTSLRKRAERMLQQANDELERRVELRTAELRTANAQVIRDMAEMRNLERQVLEISEAEQRRIGHDLHDGLGQELTGLAFLTQNLERRLAEERSAAVPEAGRIVTLINHAIEMVRTVARGFSPVELGPDGLRAGLQELSVKVADVFGVSCQFTGSADVHLHDDTAAMPIYRIAQEAVNNAVRHGRPGHLWIGLKSDNGEIILTVEDDGVGLEKRAADSDGMGIRVMTYRARMIGAELRIGQRPGGGTVVHCRYPNPSRVE